MLSRCTLGCNAGSLLDRLGGPVLPEYTYNVIRKYNSQSDLMCLIDGWCAFLWRSYEEGGDQIIASFIGFNGLDRRIAGPSSSVGIK